MTTFAHTSYADAQTLASVERADHLIEPVVAFIAGAIRGGVTTLLAIAAVVAVVRIDTVAHTPLINLAAAIAFAGLAFAVMPRRAARKA